MLDVKTVRYTITSILVDAKDVVVITSLKVFKEKIKRSQTCAECSGNYEAIDCDSDVRKCINCVFANTNNHLTRSIDHAAYEIDKCETFKFKWEQYISNTNYPWKPDLPYKITNGSK